MQDDRADDSVVADGDRRPARVPVRDPVEGGQRSLVQIGELLPARVAVVGSLPPAGVPLGIAPPGLRPVEAGEVADVHLAQAGRKDRLEPGLARHLGGRLRRSTEVAGVDRIELLAGEAAPERLGLCDPGGVQGLVGMPLPAALAIPVGLAVAREQDPGHGPRS